MKSIKTALLVALFSVIFLSAERVSAFYDPGVQRWLNRDPLGELGGVNLYGFVSNDSASNIDSFGLRQYPKDFIGPLKPCDWREGEFWFSLWGEIQDSFKGEEFRQTCEWLSCGMRGGGGLGNLSKAERILTGAKKIKSGKEAFAKVPEFRRWFHKFWKKKIKVPNKESHNPDVDLQDAWDDWCDGGGRNVK